MPVKGSPCAKRGCVCDPPAGDTFIQRVTVCTFSKQRYLSLHKPINLSNCVRLFAPTRQLDYFLNKNQ